MLGGEHGLLGVDGMAGRLLHVDFSNHCVEVYQRSSDMPVKGWLSVPARMRFGSLLLVEGDISGVRVNVLLPGGATETGMIPPSVPASMRAGLLRPDVVAAPAVYLASDASRRTTGRHIVATRWTPDAPDGEPASHGIADD
jgi:hypothetical protein